MKDAITIEFAFEGRRTIQAVFDAPAISTDGGAPLLRQVDRRLGLVDAVAAAFPDRRDVDHATHSIEELFRQRILQIALGYEDCNDAATLRSDPILKTCCDRDPISDPDLGSQPTLSRLENAAGPKACFRVASALLDNYFVRHPKPPRTLVLDLDTTDDPTHGQQELSFFHAHYDNYIYLPLLVFDQDGDLITAMLQSGRPERGKNIQALLRRLLGRIRRRWPRVRILVRADAEFASPKTYETCRRFGADFVIGFGVNPRLRRLARDLEARAERRFERTGRKARLFTSFPYRARTWPRGYRMLVKTERSELGTNTRFVVTTLRGDAEDIYDLYVQRGESSENSIKDLKRVLRADRLSCHKFFANQFRLLLHAAAYVLLFALRRACRGTELEQAQMDTLRLRLLKIAAQVLPTVRHIWVHLTSSHPWQSLFSRVAGRLLGPLPFG